MAKRKVRASEAKKESSKELEGGFDSHLERLEELVAELESGELGLEEAMERFAAGVKLLGGCREALAGYEQRVEELAAETEEGLASIDEEAEE